MSNEYGTDADVRELRALDFAVTAARLWATFTTDEKTLVRFGMFPAEKMPDLDRDGTRYLAVALMDCAKKDGGMRA